MWNFDVLHQTSLKLKKSVQIKRKIKLFFLPRIVSFKVFKDKELAFKGTKLLNDIAHEVCIGIPLKNIARAILRFFLLFIIFCSYSVCVNKIYYYDFHCAIICDCFIVIDFLFFVFRLPFFLT